MKELKLLKQFLFDTTLSLEERVEAANAIRELASDDAVAVLIQSCEDVQLPSELAHAVGVAAANAIYRNGELQTVSLRDFTEIAYLAFDHEIAKLMQRN